MQIHAPILARLGALAKTGLTSAGYADAFVGRAVPAQRPARGLTLANRGGRQQNIIQQRVIIAVTLWAETDDEADVMAAIATASILGAANDDSDNPVSHIELLTTPTDMSDPSGAPMRFFQFAVFYRSTVLAD